LYYCIILESPLKDKTMTEDREIKDILTLEEASQLFQVSTKTFLKLLREEDIPARKVGREWRFSRTALLNWIAAGSSRAYASAEEENKTYFASVAPVYDELRKGCYGEALRELLMSRFTPQGGDHVADIGAGTGYLTKSLAKYAAQVSAIDSSPDMLEVAGKDLAKAGLTNVVLMEGDAHDLPLDDSSQEMIFANLLLHHIIEPPLAIKEMFRAVKPGGTVVITDVDQHPYPWVKQEKSDIWQGFDRAEIKEWFQTAGFINIQVADLGCKCRTSSQSGATIEIPMFLATGTKPV
jgi:excisionase family DNA binding protein